MKIRLVILALTVLVCQLSFAQTPDLERLIENANNSNGKEKVLTLSLICSTYFHVDPRKGIEFGKQAIRLADSLNIPSAKTKAYNKIGVNYWALSDFPNARLYFDKAYQNAIIFNDSFEMANSCNNLGLVYEAAGKFDSSLFVFNKLLVIATKMKFVEKIGLALENIATIHMYRGELKTGIIYLLKAKDQYEKIQNQKKLPYIYLKLGMIYSETGDYKNSERWFQKGIDQSIAMKDFQKAVLGLNGIGILRKKEGRYDEALAKFNEALKASEKLNNKTLIMAINSNIGNTYTLKKEYKLAIKYHRKAAALAILLKKPIEIAIKEVNLGEAYFGLGDYRNARICYEKALPALLSSKSASNLISTYEALMKVNDSLKDYAQVVKYQHLYLPLKDSLNLNELNTALDSLKLKFNTEQTDRENLMLKQETETKNKTISLQRVLLISSLIFVSLLLTLAYFIVKSRYKLKKVNDILEQKNIEISAKAEELHLMNNKLIELSKFKDSINSFLVHDLKNPLNMIINIDTGRQADQFIEAVRQSGKQMLNIVMNLLDTSKYENSAMKISAAAVSLTQMINKAFHDVRYFADQKSIHLKLNYSADFRIQVDRDIIERVFINLFSNAIKNSSAGDSIQLFAEPRDQTMIQIMIKDSGPGIDPEFLPLIFDKFTPASGRKAGFTQSTGIGLAFCKMAIEAHSGNISADSLPGQGATFRFTLPLASAQESLAESSAEFFENEINRNNFTLSMKEMTLLAPYCDRLRNFSINQISDVKDIILTMDILESANIRSWKSAILTSVSECNSAQYDKLINIDSNVKS